MGFIYPRHEKAIEEIGGEIVLTCDIDPSKEADYTDFDEMLKDPRMNVVDYVCILTPNYLHAEMIRKCKKKVICEKPLTINTDYEGLAHANVVLQLRYNPLVKSLGRVSGEIDITVKTYREQKYWDSWKGDPERSGGILYNMGIHYIDLLIHLLGDPVQILEATHDKYLAKGRVEFERGFGSYHIELLKEPAEVIRKIKVNGKEVDLEGATIPLSDQGVMNLHTEVYKNLGHLKLKDTLKALNLVHELKNL